MNDLYLGNSATDTTLDRVAQLFASRGVQRLLFKRLAPNDNSKNQIYLGSDLEVISVLPLGSLTYDAGTSEKRSKKGPIIKAPLRMSWLTLEGREAPAPHSQVILYPQYVEVRLSGFIKGADAAPRSLFDPAVRGRESGRVLFLGVKSNGTVVSMVLPSSSAAAKEVESLQGLLRHGVLEVLPSRYLHGTADGKIQLLAELARVHRKGWIAGERLRLDGSRVSCDGDGNCGGYTLEAELGITPNGDAAPDFKGWEVKQYGVESFSRIASKVITLMTPEPDGGFYVAKGVEPFVRKYGYVDTLGRPDRINFGGIHRIGARHPRTQLTLELPGFDATRNRITDASAGLALVDGDGGVAASWSYAKLMEHWLTKHAQTAYVPSMRRLGPARYHFGNMVGLGTAPSFVSLLQTLHKGIAYYDPGIKLENASSSRPKSKRRSQFRILSGQLEQLYKSFERVDVLKS